MHPFQALEAYRKAVNPNAKLIVCAMTPSQFSIANPKDTGMLDIAGFSTSTPSVISNF
jgi:60 kDa SS-A/Ro ribonucleoprotein